eukprot:9301628-Prorocentrum_lima.AAC.1
MCIRDSRWPVARWRKGWLSVASIAQASALSAHFPTRTVALSFPHCHCLIAHCHCEDELSHGHRRHWRRQPC